MLAAMLVAMLAAMLVTVLLGEGDGDKSEDDNSDFHGGSEGWRVELGYIMSYWWRVELGYVLLVKGWIRTSFTGEELNYMF